MAACMCVATVSAESCHRAVSAVRSRAECADDVFLPASEQSLASKVAVREFSVAQNQNGIVCHFKQGSEFNFVLLELILYLLRSVTSSQTLQPGKACPPSRRPGKPER